MVFETLLEKIVRELKEWMEKQRRKLIIKSRETLCPITLVLM